MKIPQFWHNMKNFFRMIRKDHSSVLLYIMVGAFAKATLPFLSLYYSSSILNDLLIGNQKAAILDIQFLLVSSFILGCIRQACYQSLQVIADAAFYSVWKQTTHKAFVLEYEELEKTETMDKIRRAQNGSNGSGGVESQIIDSYEGLASLLCVLYSLFFTIQLMLRMDSVAMTLIIIAAFALLTFIQSKILARENQMEMQCARSNEHTNSLSSYIINTALDESNGKDIRLFKMQPLFKKYYEWLNQLLRQVFGKYAVHKGLYMGMVALSSQLFAGIVYIIVGIQVLKGKISIGSVLLYAGAIMQLSVQLTESINAYHLLAYRFEYLGNFEAFINAKNMHYDGTLPIEKRDDYEYEFEFRNVSFKYPNTDTYVLNHINLTLNVGRRFAIVGQNGAGKTTLIKLLCRLYEPTSGEILLNGINIEKYDFAEYTQIFSVVFQDFKLHPMPLDQNIACSNDVDEARCLEVLAQAGIKERVMSFPDKQHTLLYKNLGGGITVSGGEAQKIAIARALYKDAPMVIMDEPTAALDPIAEAEIYESFNKLIQNKTAIFISHRMSSCKFCDEIVVFEHGQIIQRGSHEKLVHENGLYRELWNAQAQYYA